MIASRTMSFGSPGRYIQGPGEIRRLAQHTAKYGDKVFAVIDPFFYDSLTPQLTAQYEEHHAQFTSIPFEHEVTEERIAAIARKAAEAGAQMIMGIGGGKTLDTAKGAANNA